MEQEFLIKRKAMDLFSIDGLQKQTGVEKKVWHTYILKELLDNAIDACEAAGISPKIKVSIDLNQELTIRVKDNGPGPLPTNCMGSWYFLPVGPQ